MKERAASGPPHVIDFDSTQTMRAVTVRELHDPHQQKYFAVQLVVSERPVNLETMPRLDVFAAYSLYAVEGHHGNASCYALRLGFFTQEEAAQPICEYLKSFFRSPSVVRVSSAEQARFERPKKVPTPPQKSARWGSANVVDLNSAARTGSTPPAEPRKPVVNASSKLKLDKTLSRELLEEARQVELSKTGSHRVPRQPGSWVAKLLGRPKR